MNLQVPISELQKHSIFIATPMYGGQCFGSYTKSAIDLSRVCMQYGINAQFSFIFNESLITRARNYIVDEFMRSGFTHLMFIDSDIDFNPDDVIALLALDKPIVGGPYPKKCVAWENIYDAVRYDMVPNNNRAMLAEFAGDFVFNPVPGTAEMKLDQPVEVLEIGTGFMMVKREVFTQFAEKYPQYWYNPDHNRSSAFDGSRKIFQYFQAEIEPERGRYLSEDYWFCQKARQAGIPVWFAPWMQLKHHGTYIYGGSIPAMATVVQKRMERNEPVPPPASVDGPKPQAPLPVQVMTLKDFDLLARQQKRFQLKQFAEVNKVDVEALRDAYAAQKDQFTPETPIDEVIKKIVESLGGKE